jgi:hypothetical protein
MSTWKRLSQILPDLGFGGTFLLGLFAGLPLLPRSLATLLLLGDGAAEWVGVTILVDVRSTPLPLILEGPDALGFRGDCSRARCFGPPCGHVNCLRNSSGELKINLRSPEKVFANLVAVLIFE